MRYFVSLSIFMLALPLKVSAQQTGGMPDIESGLAGNAISIVALLTVLSLAPGIAIMVTCFPFIVTVLSILRQSIGLQQSPPNMLIVSLSMFMTWFIMDPVFQEAWEVAGSPLRKGEISISESLKLGIEPFRSFMLDRVNPLAIQQLEGISPRPDIDSDHLPILIPAFILSEIQRAFEIGFLIALPFLIIDLVVSAVLMSMGMMMVPPVVVSLPFKLAFFVVTDGWLVLANALMGYA